MTTMTYAPAGTFFALFVGRGGHPDDVTALGYSTYRTHQDLMEAQREQAYRNTDLEQFETGLIDAGTSPVTTDEVNRAHARLVAFVKSARPQPNARQRERDRRDQIRADCDVL